MPDPQTENPLLATLRRYVLEIIEAIRGSQKPPEPRRYIIEFSESYTKLAFSLVKARAGFAKIVTDQTASIKSDKADYKYKYADLGGVINATAASLAEHGIVVLQAPTTGDNATLVTVETLVLHESGEWARTRISLKSTANTPQGVGSAITYARRYALQGVLGVAAEDDDGHGDRGRSGDPRPPQPQPPRSDPAQRAPTTTTSGAPAPMPGGMLAAIRKLLGDMKLEERLVVLEATNTVKASAEQLTFTEGNTLLQALQRRKAEAK
jgi:hypothetical protein